MTGKRILLADDDPDFVEVIRTVLAREGYEVITAAKANKRFKWPALSAPI
ncbi:MAG: response regulator [Chloroflexi bacterium]|nr:response regulator [Chloroflexota bacterium]